MTKPVKFGMTRKELLELPMCKFSDQGKHRYSSLLIVPTKELHDSGYRLMAIVGLDEDGKPIEIADFCDDIEWKTPILHRGSPIEMGALRTAPNGEGERWDEREVAQTRNTFDNGEKRCQEVVVSMAQNTRDEVRIVGGDGQIAGALPAEPGMKQQTYVVVPTPKCDLNTMRYIVRRLTPIECERLMGLPDDYCIPTGLRRFFDANGEPSPELVAEFQRIHDTFGAIMAEYEHAKPPKPKTAAQVQKWLAKITDPATCPDSPRYKGCGNGWATNQPRWILTRLLYFTEQENTQTTQNTKGKE